MRDTLNHTPHVVCVNCTCYPTCTSGMTNFNAVRCGYFRQMVMDTELNNKLIEEANHEMGNHSLVAVHSYDTDMF